jgi:hypothetical protein
VYPNLKPARLVGYEGISPGPTIIIPKDTESVVRFVNNADRENSVHLHGSPSRAPFDGWAADLTLRGQYKDYYYPNYESARFLWYHDHAIHWVISSLLKYLSNTNACRLPKTRTSVRLALISLPTPARMHSNYPLAMAHLTSRSFSRPSSTTQTVH